MSKLSQTSETKLVKMMTESPYDVYDDLLTDHFEGIYQINVDAGHEETFDQMYDCAVAILDQINKLWKQRRNIVSGIQGKVMSVELLNNTIRQINPISGMIKQLDAQFGSYMKNLGVDYISPIC